MRKLKGQMAVALTLSMGIFVGGYYLWGYLRHASIQALSSKQAYDLAFISNNILSRLRLLLVQPATNCETFSGLGVYQPSGKGLAVFRDLLEKTDPSLIIKGKVNTQSVTQKNNAGQDVQMDIKTIGPIACLLSEVEGKQLGLLEVRVNRVGQPNINSRATRLSVVLNAKSTEITKGGTSIWAGEGRQASIQIVKNFVVHTASLTNFGIIVYPVSSSSTPFFKVESGSTLEILGSVLYAGPKDISITDIIEEFPPPDPPGKIKVTFNRTFYARSAAVTLSLDAGKTLDVSKVKQVFRNGIETGVLSYLTGELPLPNSTDISTVSGYTINQAWDALFDYRFVYKKDPNDLTKLAVGGAPLQDLSYLKSPPDAPKSFTVSKDNSHDPNQLTDQNAVFKNKNPVVIPDVTNTNMTSLDETCFEGSTPAPTFVFLNHKKDLTLNFSDTSKIFCGIVLTNKLTIVPNTANKVALFGYFAFSQLVIKGSADVYIYNPADNVPIMSGATPLPGSQNQFSLYGQLASVGTSWAKNYFVPIFMDLASASQKLVYRPFLPSRPGLPNPPGSNTADHLVCCSSTSCPGEMCINPSQTTPSLINTVTDHTKELAYFIEDAS